MDTNEHQLDQHDLYMVRRRIPIPVAKALKYAKGDPRAILAGGFIRAIVGHEEAADIDLFVADPLHAEITANRIETYANEGEKVKLRRMKTDNALSIFGLSLPVQIITRWTYPDAGDLVSSFDFSVCQAAAWWTPKEGLADGHWNSLVGERFYTDLASKRLTYTQPKRHEDAGGSLLRVLKYYQRGYRIPLSDLGAVVARLLGGVDFQKTDPSNQEKMKMVLAGLLREVDPLIDPDHIMHEGEPVNGAL